MEDEQKQRVEGFGALVGWTHQDLGERIMLRLQSKHRAADDGSDLDEFLYLMTKSQAAVLANYLYGISGKLPQPKRRRSWFR